MLSKKKPSFSNSPVNPTATTTSFVQKGHRMSSSKLRPWSDRWGRRVPRSHTSPRWGGTTPSTRSCASRPPTCQASPTTHSKKEREREFKALFNNVPTLENLSCMALHAISVFDRVWKQSPWQKLQFKKLFKCSKKVKICKWPEMPY